MSSCVAVTAEDRVRRSRSPTNSRDGGQKKKKNSNYLYEFLKKGARLLPISTNRLPAARHARGLVFFFSIYCHPESEGVRERWKKKNKKKGPNIPRKYIYVLSEGGGAVDRFGR